MTKLFPRYGPFSLILYNIYLQYNSRFLIFSLKWLPSIHPSTMLPDSDEELHHRQQTTVCRLLAWTNSIHDLCSHRIIFYHSSISHPPHFLVSCILWRIYPMTIDGYLSRYLQALYVKTATAYFSSCIKNPLYLPEGLRTGTLRWVASLLY